MEEFTPIQINEIKKGMEELRWTVWIMVLIICPFFFILSLVDITIFSFLLLIGITLTLISSVLIFKSGRAVWWYILMSSFFTLFIIMALLIINSVKINSLFWNSLIYSAIALGSLVALQWASGIYNQAMMKIITNIKRIDFDSGTYSPFRFSTDMIRMKNKTFWLFIVSTYGPLFVSLSIFAARWMNKNAPEISNLWTLICAAIIVPLMIAGIRAGFGEYSYIRDWEKQTGRKMHLSYVVGWKLLTPAQKKRRRSSKKKVPFTFWRIVNIFFSIGFLLFSFMLIGAGIFMVAVDRSEFKSSIVMIIFGIMTLGIGALWLYANLYSDHETSKPSSARPKKRKQRKRKDI